MFSCNIKGKENPKAPQLVKLEMIFFKTGYARVPKVLSITGPCKDWDNETQSFTPKSSETIEKNKRLLDLKTKYLKVAEDWEAENKPWAPAQWALWLQKFPEFILFGGRAEINIELVGSF